MNELALFLAGLSLGFGLCWWRLQYWRDRAIWAETLESMRLWTKLRHEAIQLHKNQTDWLEHLYKGDE